MERLEEKLLKNSDDNVVHKINALKREAIYLRRSVWPLREAISSLQRGGSKLINSMTQPFFRDIYDHTVQVIDTIETLRDMVSGMMDLHLTTVSNRMNEVMKVLTIIATIFIPLTFITGVYGMNFRNMPELLWQHSYFYVLGFMFIIFVLEI